MIPKTDYFAWVDRYLNGELSKDDLSLFETELKTNHVLANELRLHQEVECFIREDISELRGILSELTNHVSQKKQSIELAFKLSSEEKSVLKDKIFDEVNLKKMVNQLHRVHVSQHRKQKDERLLDLVPPLTSNRIKNDIHDNITERNNLLFEDIKQAIQEDDIMKLRAEIEKVVSDTSLYSLEEIEQYIDGNLNKKQSDSFEEELVSNEHLASAVKLSEEINAAVSENDVMDLRAMLKGISSSHKEMITVASDEKQILSSESTLLNEIEDAVQEEDIMKLRAELKNIQQKGKERPIVHFIGRTQKSWKMVAACAVFAVMIGGTWVYFDGRKVPSIYDQFYTPYQSMGIERSGNGSQGVLSLALQKYNEHRYQEALPLFQQVIRQNSNDPAGHFYAGMSYQELRQYRKAIFHYNQVIRNHDNLFVEQAQWYMGLCFLQTNDKNKAIPLFQRIKKEQGYYSSKAEKVLKEIE